MNIRRKQYATFIAVVITIFALPIFIVGCASRNNEVSMRLRPARGDSARIEDLKLFCATLPVLHKDFFAHTTREEFDTACLTALDKVDAMTDIEFYFALCELAAMAGDAHTMVGPTQDIAVQMHAIPGQIAKVDGIWRFIVIDSALSDLLGAEVLAINGDPMEDIVMKASKLYGHDNDAWLEYLLGQRLNITDLYRHIGIAESQTARVRFEVLPLGASMTQEIALQPVSVEAFHQLDLSTLVTSQPETGRTNVPYRMLTLGNDDAAFVQYNACMSWDQLPIDEFTTKVLSLIEEMKPRRVIVDLRYNGGGNSSLLEPMIGGLATLQKQQGFPIDVLIGAGTFSSALMNAVQLKQRTDCRLVGSPTGGSVNHYGEIKSFTLPNSGIPVQYSTKYFMMDDSYPAGSLQPDLLVRRTVDDLRNGVDTEVLTILR